MRIHVGRNGQQFGPYTVAEVRRYLDAGELLSSDIAWYKGAPGWMPIHSVPGVGAERSVWASPHARLEAPSALLDAAPFGYAGFWRRFAARLLDGVLLMLAVLPLSLLLGGAIGAAGGPEAARSAAGLVNLLTLVLHWLYFAVQESSSQQATFGKRALGIRVTDLDGRRLSFARASARHFAALLNYITLYIGWMMVGWTERKQGLHDSVAGTLVVNREARGTEFPAWAAVLVAMFGVGLPVLGILAAIAIPAYSDYTQRAKVSAALYAAEPAKLALAEWYAEHRHLPESLEEIGFHPQPQAQLRNIEFVGQSLVLTLNVPGSELDGKTLGLEPFADGGQRSLLWRCGRAARPSSGRELARVHSETLTTIKNMHLPSSCRPG